MPNMALIPAAETRIPALQVYVDGFPSVSHGLESSTGGAPLESGARVTDHTIAHEPTLTVTGHVSGHPQARGATPRDAWDRIRALHSFSTTLLVITPFGVYEEMIISRINATQVGRGIDFRMELTDILRVGAAASPGESDVSGPASGRTPNVPRGRVQTTPF